MSAIGKPPCDEGVIRGAPREAPCLPRQRTWVLVATILASSMAFIDGSVVNVALPVLQAELDATVADVQWVVEIYALFLSALILVGGSLGDHYGRRRVFTIGVALFTIASVGCGLAQSVSQLIAARAVQGIGAALLVPGSLAIISASFAEEERGRAIGTWSGFSAITAGMGPLVGGLLIEHISWRAAFFINVPLAAVVLPILLTRVPESRDESARKLDLPGAALCTLGLGALIYGLIESTSLTLLDPLVLTAEAIGVVILILFVAVEARGRTPMMPLDLFRARTFSGANILTVLLYGALGEISFFLPFDLIRVHGYTAAGAGAAFLPSILIMFVLSRWSGGLINRFGATKPLLVGPIIAAAGFALFALPGTGGSYWTTFFPASVLQGLGMAITVAPLTTVVMGAVPEQRAGIASGINNAAARAAGLFSIAAVSIVVLHIFGDRLDGQLTALHVSPHLRHALDTQRTKLADIPIPPGTSAATHATLQHAIAQSFVSGFRAAALIGAALALGSALTAGTMIRGERAVEALDERAKEREVSPQLQAEPSG